MIHNEARLRVNRHETWGQFHQHWRPTFSHAQNEKLFLRTNLANGARNWQTAHNFCCLNSANTAHILMLKLLVKLNGEFFAERCAPARRLFAWRTKFGKIDPGSPSVYSQT